MYIRQIFHAADQEQAKAFVKQHPFATLISSSSNRMVGTHIPLLWGTSQAGSDYLYGHLARANPQWKDIARQEVLAIFMEPHAYISSSWYEKPNVPTWNYIAVHIYGEAQLLEGKALEAHLQKIVSQFEADQSTPFELSHLSPTYYQAQLRGIVGIAIEVKSIEANYKLSQNRNDTDYVNIITQLEQQKHPLAKAIAQEMRKQRGEG